MAWSNTLFYIAFATQIYLLSWYFPNKLLARMQYVFATYPPQTYPKLYPQPIEKYKTAHLAFKFASRIVLLVGIAMLAAILFWVDHSTFADDGYISEAWPAALGMLQFLPLIALEFSEFSNFRLMRKANVSAKRVADLRRRGLTDLVSPVLLIMAALFFCGAVLFDFYVHDFDVSWGHDTIQRALVMAVTNALLAIVGAWNLLGRKTDPHQTTEDRTQRIRVGLKSLLYISMALSVFIAMTAADDIFSLDAVDALVMSIYFQAIALLSLGYTLNNVKPEELNFDVYKEGTSATNI